MTRAKHTRAQAPRAACAMSLYEVIACLAQSCSAGGLELLMDRIEARQ